MGALALIVGLVAAPAARAATSPDYFGTNLQSLGAVPHAKWGSFLDQLAPSGMTVNRFELGWKDAEPNPPTSGGKHTYNWGYSDDIITLMAQRGLRAAPVFRFVPQWAQGTNADGSTAARLPNGNVDEFPPSQYANFAAFLAAFAQRYGVGLKDGSGPQKLGTFWAQHPGLTPQPTVSYEIWNEINLAQYAWNHTPDPVAYTALLKVIRPVLRAEQPAAIMLGDLAWQNSTADNAGVYPDYALALGAAGGLDQLDAMGYHPYAPDADSIFTLVRRLRSELDQAGYPGMPIYANEAGLPADFNGPGIQFAADIPGDDKTLQFPSDGARASSLEFAGEALADSDCGVEQFLPYSITGTETTNDPIHEGFMGIIRKDGTPTKTLIGLQRASERWRAKAAPGGTGIPPRLGICGGGASPDASLLTIPATFTSGAGGCVDMVDTYDGNPMEGVWLRLIGANGTEVASARSDAYGHAQACPPDPRMTFTAFGAITNAGVTGVLQCDIQGLGCSPGVTYTLAARGTVSATAVAGSSGVPVPTPVPTLEPSGLTPEQKVIAAGAKKCVWKLRVDVKKTTLVAGKKTSRVSMRPLLQCSTIPVGTAVRFALTVHRKGKKTPLQSRSVFLRTGKAQTVDVVGTLATTDTISFTHAADVKTNVPQITKSIRIRAPKVRK